ncbi:hypothetical protein niasHS_017298 [Heterodera schachtii]|uniref:VQ domain-containing protein n=2 Tax=Heterodera TaxID=34509 RepID=A0ABD2HQ78_HETSC
MISALHFVSLLAILALAIDAVNGAPKKEKGKNANTSYIECDPTNFRQIVQQQTGQPSAGIFTSLSNSDTISFSNNNPKDEKALVVEPERAYCQRSNRFLSGPFFKKT